MLNCQYLLVYFKHLALLYNNHNINILALYKGVNYSDTGITKYVNLLVHFIKVYLYLVSTSPPFNMITYILNETLVSKLTGLYDHRLMNMFLLSTLLLEYVPTRYYLLQKMPID